MFIGRSLAQGHFPLWNPLNYCGMPEAAISSPNIFYPLTWIFAIGSFSVGLSVLMILSQAIMGLGTFLLVFSFGWGELAAITAGTTIAFSGYMFSLSNNYTIVSAASWFPFLLWAASQMHKKSANPPPVYTVLLACSIGLLVNAGRPEIWLPAMICFFVYIAFLLRNTASSERAPLAVSYGRAVIIGGLFSMPSLLPALEWAPLSRRGEGLDPQEVLMFSASWYDLLSMFVGQGLGELQLRHSDLRALVQPKSLGPYFSSAFLSSFVGALALVGLQKKGALLFKIAIGGLLFFVVASLGSSLPFSDLIVRLPAVSILRFPSKLLVFVSFGLALLAARGVRNYFQEGIRKWYPEAVIGFGLIASLCLLISPFQILPFIKLESRDFFQLAMHGQQLIAQSSCLWFFLALVLLFFLRFMQKIQLKNVGASVAVVSISAALLFHAFKYCHYEGPADFFDKKSIVVSTLQNHNLIKIGEMLPRVAPIFVQRFTVPLEIDSGGSLKSSIGSYQYSREVLRPFTNMDFNFPEVFGFEGAMVGEYFYLFLNSYMKSGQYIFESSAERMAQTSAPTDLPLARFLQMTSAPIALTQVWRYLSVRRPHEPVPLLDSRLFELVAEDKPMNFRVYRVHNTLPRAYLSYTWKTCASRDDVITTIYDAEKSGWDANNLTLLEPTAGSLPDCEQGQPVEPLKLEELCPEKLSLKAAPTKPCILVLSDQFYPGWKVRIDGNEGAIIRCNGFMRGVHLEPGQHAVEFTYEPESVKYGLILAAIGGLWLLAIFFSRIAK